MNHGFLQERSRENKVPIVFVHPCEFLVTGPDGAILPQTLLGDRLLVTPAASGTAEKRGEVATPTPAKNRGLN